MAGASCDLKVAGPTMRNRGKITLLGLMWVAAC